MPISPALRMLRQDEQKFENELELGCIVRPCQEQKMGREGGIRWRDERKEKETDRSLRVIASGLTKHIRLLTRVTSPCMLNFVAPEGKMSMYSKAYGTE